MVHSKLCSSSLLFSSFVCLVVHIFSLLHSFNNVFYSLITDSPNHHSHSHHIHCILLFITIYHGTAAVGIMEFALWILSDQEQIWFPFERCVQCTQQIKPKTTATTTTTTPPKRLFNGRIGWVRVEWYSSSFFDQFFFLLLVLSIIIDRLSRYPSLLKNPPDSNNSRGKVSSQLRRVLFNVPGIPSFYRIDEMNNWNNYLLIIRIR